jgi:hypothetical protein
MRLLTAGRGGGGTYPMRIRKVNVKNRKQAKTENPTIKIISRRDSLVVPPPVPVRTAVQRLRQATAAMKEKHARLTGELASLIEEHANLSEAYVTCHNECISFDAEFASFSEEYASLIAMCAKLADDLEDAGSNLPRVPASVVVH